LNLGRRYRVEEKMEKKLVSEYKKLYNSIPRILSYTKRREKQRRMKEIRKTLVQNFGWSWKEANNLGKE